MHSDSDVSDFSLGRRRGGGGGGAPNGSKSKRAFAILSARVSADVSRKGDDTAEDSLDVEGFLEPEGETPLEFFRGGGGSGACPE